MVHDDALAIASTWSFWDRPVPDSVPRRVSSPAELRESLALVIQGVRRCGKSTLLRQLMARYKLNPKHCLFVNLEDPRLSNALTHDAGRLRRLLGAPPAREAPGVLLRRDPGGHGLGALAAQSAGPPRRARVRGVWLERHAPVGELGSVLTTVT